MKGIFSALVIPFDEDGNVMEENLRNVIDYNIEVSGVDGLYINGSTGENFIISSEQKKQIFKIVSQHVNKRVHLIAHVGSINLNEAVSLAKYVEEIGGFDALSAITPFYYKFNFDEIKHYYETIIEATNMNMIIYSIPLLTGVSMSMDNFDELLSNDKIIGVKFTSNDFYTLERLISAYPDKLFYSGFDEMLLSAASVGIDGAIGSTYNYQAFIAKKVLEGVEQGDLELARVNQHTLNNTIDILIGAGLYQTIKAVLTVSGTEAGICKAPLSATTQEQYESAQTIKSIISKGV